MLRMDRSPRNLAIAVSFAVLGWQSSPSGAQLDYGLRLHHSSHFDRLDDDYRTDNLLRFSIGGFRGGEIGFERLDDGDQQAFAAKIPLSRLFGLSKTLDLFFHRSEFAGGEESEVYLSFKPKANVEIIARGYDLSAVDGWSVAAHYRRDVRFDAASNHGFGAIYATELDRDAGAYAWFQSEKLKRLFVGAGRYLRDDRWVVGMTVEDGGFAWRYFAIDANSGFQLNEFLFSTDARYLKMRDAHSALISIKSSDSFTFRGGVFRYLDPPISARGRGLTGGIIHRRIPNVGDSFEIELVNYWFRDFFAGFNYRFPKDEFDDGRIALPLGLGFERSDGLTRNFLRVVPTYDRRTEDFSVTAILEYKIVWGGAR